MVRFSVFVAVATLLASPAYAAGDGDISNTTLGVGMVVVGVVIMAFSGARAEQQSGRLGMEEDSSGTAMVKWLYVGMGALMAIAGLLTALGIIVPATAS